jgi:hypothetical protein
MNKWAAISNRTYIWNYVTSFGSYLQPFPNWYVLGPNIQYFAKHGVKGIFEEGSYGTPGADMQALKAYVIGRMLWDVNLDAEKLIVEFLDGYFGTAAPDIRLYMDTFHQSVVDTGYCYLFFFFVIRFRECIWYIRCCLIASYSNSLVRCLICFCQVLHARERTGYRSLRHS